MNTIAIIPARYASSRFPGKPLININGISMIERVYLQVMKAKLVDEIVVATDDDRIFSHVYGFGGVVVYTDSNHKSGTDRCLEALETIQNETYQNYDVVINVQGDEPFINPEVIDIVASSFQDKNVDIATIKQKIDSIDDLKSPNVVKLTTTKSNKALYFSRSIIPYVKNEDLKKYLQNETFFKHIGIYGYRTDVLKEIATKNISKLEDAEKLEQLRWIENDYKIYAFESDAKSYAIDTVEDLENIEKLIEKGIL